jgi:hypothetical protein
MAKDVHRVVDKYALWMFFVFGVRHRCRELRTVRRTGDCLMTAQPNRYSPHIWRKSSASGGGGECVEVAKWRSFVLVRDSGDRSGTVLELTSAQWIALLRRLKNEEIG